MHILLYGCSSCFFNNVFPGYLQSVHYLTTNIRQRYKKIIYIPNSNKKTRQLEDWKLELVVPLVWIGGMCYQGTSWLGRYALDAQHPHDDSFQRCIVPATSIWLEMGSTRIRHSYLCGMGTHLRQTSWRMGCTRWFCHRCGRYLHFHKTLYEGGWCGHITSCDWRREMYQCGNHLLNDYSDETTDIYILRAHIYDNRICPNDGENRVDNSIEEKLVHTDRYWYFLAETIQPRILRCF